MKGQTMATNLASIVPAATMETAATLHNQFDRVRTLSLALVAGLSAPLAACLYEQTAIARCARHPADARDFTANLIPVV
jgi:hypothetical protein